VSTILTVYCTSVIYPLDTVKTRLQALPPEVLKPKQESSEVALPAPASSRRSHKLNLRDAKRLPHLLARRLRRWQMLNTLLRILREEGISGAFKGFSANMINTFSMRASGVSR
jgi:hypothetical protein